MEVANDGSNPVVLTGLELTDYTAQQIHAHIYKFPGYSDGSAVALPPGKSAYVFTGSGTSEWTSDGHLLLFWGRSASVWNDDGDVAYLRQDNGQFIDWRTVGDPKRHPGGH